MVCFRYAVPQSPRGALMPGSATILFNCSKKETHQPSTQFKKMCQRLKGTYKLAVYVYSCRLRPSLSCSSMFLLGLSSFVGGVCVGAGGWGPQEQGGDRAGHP